MGHEWLVESGVSLMSVSYWAQSLEVGVVLSRYRVQLIKPHSLDSLCGGQFDYI